MDQEMAGINAESGLFRLRIHRNLFKRKKAPQMVLTLLRNWYESMGTKTNVFFAQSDPRESNDGID